MSSFVTKAEVVLQLKIANPSIVEADISDNLLASTAELLSSKIGDTFIADTVDTTMLVDGNDNSYIFTNRVPIASLTSVKIISSNATEKEELIISGVNSQVWVDYSKGKIEFIRSRDIEDGEESPIMYFPLRPSSVEIIGKFGSASTDLVKYTQILLILQALSVLNPSVYKTDLISEEIGKYKWVSSSTLKKGATLKDYIDECMTAINATGRIDVEGI